MQSAPFTPAGALDASSVVAYLVARGIVPPDADLAVEELAGGVSSPVLAVRGAGIALVVKQALPRLRVAEEWHAPARRTDTEAAALRLAGYLLPGRVPHVVDSDSDEHVVVMEHAPPGWRNWQGEILAGRVHPEAGSWAGDTLGRLHAATAGDAEIAAEFDDHEAFELLRLDPYHEAVMRRIPRLAAAIEPLVDELRSARTCLVHGDYAPKNILLGRDGAWVIDAEVTHVGHPVFDLAFFLAFPLMFALQRPELAAQCDELAGEFTRAYAARAGKLMPAPRSLAAHTGAMLLARTEGKSPATFLDPPAARRARELGEQLLTDPHALAVGTLATALA
jgi:5-methylthioribose kinase